MSVYSEAQRELSPGDQVRFTENDYHREIVNGERGTVVAHDSTAHTLTIEKQDGTRILLDADKPLHLDHGYCQTIHSAQGQTSERVMIEAEASNTIGNESLYYVAVSRAEHEVSIYTNDKEALPDAMSRLDEKSAALDLPDHKHSESGHEYAL
jgi:ATP-dependent exoDNAse (exonuclease V) alpha subunit